MRISDWSSDVCSSDLVLAERSAVGPAPQHVVVDAGQLHDDRIAVAALGNQLLDIGVELEQQGALAVVADHALQPEKRGDASAAGHRRDRKSTRLNSSH